MNLRSDAFGEMLLDEYLGKGSVQIIERDDGLISAADPSNYFQPFTEWTDDVRQAIQYASGNVLDIGCGAGRHALYLQLKDLKVLGIDVSPLALEVCRRRGLKHRQLSSITKLSSKIGLFDTILLLGNNFGLVSNPRRARWLLRRFHAMTSPEGLILAASTDPYQTAEPVHVFYHQNNRLRGRMSGQLRLRVRYREIKDPWFDYLLVSLAEMENILRNTGWRVQETFDVNTPQYVAVIKKEK